MHRLNRSEQGHLSPCFGQLIRDDRPESRDEHRDLSCGSVPSVLDEGQVVLRVGTRHLGGEHVPYLDVRRDDPGGSLHAGFAEGQGASDHRCDRRLKQAQQPLPGSHLVPRASSDDVVGGDVHRVDRGQGFKGVEEDCCLVVTRGEVRTPRKLPSPQAGSRKRASMRSVSSFTRSSMASTSHSGVNTSP